MSNQANKSVDRETLYNEVWSEPVSVVAPRYGLSDVGLAKICRSLAIPLPSRGYWAKVKAGKVMGRAPLPGVSGPEPIGTGLRRLPPEQAAAREEARKLTARLRKTVVSITPPDASAPPHPLVKAASKRLRQRDGWPKDTLVRSAPKEVLNLAVTRGALDRALQFTDALIKALSAHALEVVVDKEHGETLVRAQGTGIQMECALSEHVRRTRHEATPAEERTRKRYWERSRWDRSLTYPHIPQYDYHPTGKLTFKVGRWPSKTWNDTPRTLLEARLEEIVVGIVLLAKETHAKEQEAARVAAERRRAQERYEFLVRRRTDEAERFKHLEAEATGWERAIRLRAYADAVEQRAVANGELAPEVEDWLAWARAKADWLDPLIQVSDPILDAPEPKRPGYW